MITIAARYGMIALHFIGSAQSQHLRFCSAFFCPGTSNSAYEAFLSISINVLSVLRGCPAQHTVQGLPFLSPHAPVDVFGINFGLEFVLSFSYWCVDFLLVQRLCAAKNAKDMLRTPSVAIIAKLILPLVLVVPGLAAMNASSANGTFDLSLPQLLLRIQKGLPLSLSRRL